jgi:hypothetical protein
LVRVWLLPSVPILRMRAASVTETRRCVRLMG